MSFADAISTCLSKYATFTGRARRSEYWYFALGSVLVSVIASVLDAVLDVNVIALLASLALLLPSLAVTVRRLHDTSRSAWWLLIALVPIFGGLALIVFACLDSTPADNAYGPYPKAVTPAHAHI
jgi:uncharacterized membrane protein YhaH (DUF805 family)